MAFYPLLIPVFTAAGYDPLVGISVVLLGSGAGVLASTVNPFATGIASGFAGVSLGDGLVVRIIMLVVFDAAAIWYVMAYAARVRNHPERSLTAGLAPAGTAKKGGDIPALVVQKDISHHGTPLWETVRMVTNDPEQIKRYMAFRNTVQMIRKLDIEQARESRNETPPKKREAKDRER